MESRLKSDTRGPRETIRFGRGAEPKRSPLPVNKTVDSTLPRPQQKLPLYRYSAESVQSTAAIGSEDDRAKAFDERAPEGGILVGAHVITGKNFGGAVSAIGPIFQVGQQYKTLGVHGVAEGEPHVIVAPAGHAVGGVQIRSGLVMDAIRLVYMPVKGRQLDAEKVEYSEWVGGDGGSEREIIGDGSLVVGFGGSVLEDELRTVHLRFVDPDNVRVVSEKRAAPKRDETASPRKWKSANGKFEVEARLESFDGNEAVLIRQDGKKITVASDKLSDADRAFLRRWQRSQAKAEAEPEQE